MNLSQAIFFNSVIALVSFLVGFCFVYDTIEHQHRAVGIKYIKQCKIDTPNCHSNWYEIVWEDDKIKQ